MEHVLLVVHIIACLALIGVVLLQRSEGGALGMGGGGGGGGLMSGRGAASSLTRATMILGAVFFTTSLVLTSLATRDTARNSALEDAAARSIEFQRRSAGRSRSRYRVGRTARAIAAPKHHSFRSRRAGTINRSGYAFSVPALAESRHGEVP